MAVGMLQTLQGVTKQQYDQVNEKMFGQSPPPTDQLPDGLIVHSAGPAENVTPLIRHAVVARYGTRPAELIDRVSARLRTGDVRALDARVALGEDPSAIAAQWLAAQGMG